jgi:hypothetical protein
MARIDYVEPEVLQSLIPLEPASVDPLLKAQVDKALAQLPMDQQELVIARIYQGKTLNQIMKLNNLSRESVISEFNEAMRQLQLLLADFVWNRWNIGTGPVCRICGHPQLEIINRMLENKPDSESWGAFGKRLSIEIGEKIGPPRILITHQNHIKRSTNGAFGR